MGLPPKLWFKLQRLRTALRGAFGSKQPTYEAVHRMCPNCRALIDRNDTVCPLCGAPTRPARARSGTGPERILGVIPVPSTATSVLVAVNILVYAATWYLTQQASSASASSQAGWGGISGQVLLRMGAKFGPLIYAGQWWRLVTAMFLHAGLFHIGMNMWVLFDIGPMAEALFSSAKFAVVYLVSGVAGFLLSLWWSPYGMSVGASGAVLGLIGVLIGVSFHHGRLGMEFRGQLWRWLIYMLIFGIFFAVDNAAHIGGLVAGLLFGYFVPEGEPETRASESLWNALAVVSVVIIAASFALMALQLNQPLR